MWPAGLDGCGAAGVGVVVLATGVATAACAVDGEPAIPWSTAALRPRRFRWPAGTGSSAFRRPSCPIVGDVSGMPVGAHIDPSDCAPQAIGATSRHRRGADSVLRGRRRPARGVYDGDHPHRQAVVRRDGDGVPVPGLPTVVGPAGDRRAALRPSSRPQVGGADAVGYVRTETAGARRRLRPPCCWPSAGTSACTPTAGGGSSESVQQADPALVRLLQAAVEAGLRLSAGDRAIARRGGTGTGRAAHQA